MKYNSGFLILVFCLTLLDADVSQQCWDKAISQTAMNRCAGLVYHNAAKKLKKILSAIKKKHKSDRIFLQRLQKSQEAWVQSRDADLKMEYPCEKDPKVTYGSIYPMCLMISKTKLTQQRIAYLNQWLAKAEEGEVCNGSKD